MVDLTQTRVESEEISENEARFRIEPLESGFGTTLGNALRRVLLSSLPGAAVTSIRIDGVHHEFSTIPHVREDVTELILNIKKIRLRSYTDDPVELRLDAMGEGEATAGDIGGSSDVDIINPDLHLATLDSPQAKLSMTLIAEKGKGFQAAEQKEGLAIRDIPVDAIFTPIQKVEFHVEPTRVGQSLNYDRLTLTVVTDGTIDPEDALRQAAEILVRQFQLVADFKSEQTEAQKQPLSSLPIPPRLMDAPIQELGLSTRSYNCLKRSNITKIGQLLTMNEEDLLAVRNFGRKSLDELRDRLMVRGLIEKEA